MKESCLFQIRAGFAATEATGAISHVPANDVVQTRVAFSRGMYWVLPLLCSRNQGSCFDDTWVVIHIAREGDLYKPSSNRHTFTKEKKN